MNRTTKLSGHGSRLSGPWFRSPGTGSGFTMGRDGSPNRPPLGVHNRRAKRARPTQGIHFPDTPYSILDTLGPPLHKPQAGCTFARLSAKPSAAGTRSRRPKAERLTPERPMPRWPSPVTRKRFPNRQPLTAVRLLLHLCTSRRRVALLHSGQHVVLSLPKAFTPPLLHTQYSILSKSTFAPAFKQSPPDRYRGSG